MLHLIERSKTIGLLKPAADAAGRTGRWVTIKDAHRTWLIAYMDQGNAATIALTPKQATAVAGTGIKNLVNNVPIWTILDLAASDAWVRQADGVTFTTDAGVKEKLVAFEIEAAALDVPGGFDCVTLVTGASNVANITSALAVLDSRYGQVTIPTAVTD
jgi:hypothetical protein